MTTRQTALSWHAKDGWMEKLYYSPECALAKCFFLTKGALLFNYLSSTKSFITSQNFMLHVYYGQPLYEF